MAAPSEPRCNSILWSTPHSTLPSPTWRQSACLGASYEPLVFYAHLKRLPRLFAPTEAFRVSFCRSCRRGLMNKMRFSIITHAGAIVAALALTMSVGVVSAGAAVLAARRNTATEYSHFGLTEFGDGAR